MTATEVAIVMLGGWILLGAVVVLAICAGSWRQRRRAKRALTQTGLHTIPPDVYERLRTKPRAKLEPCHDYDCDCD